MVQLCGRNIFALNELKEMEIDNIKEYYQMIDRLVELFPEVENALDTGDICPRNLKISCWKILMTNMQH